jgi:hypothetical protein
MHCPACGVEVIPEAVYCHRCGQRLSAAGDEPAKDSRDAEPSTSGPAGILTPAESVRREAGTPPEEEIWRGGYSPKAMAGAWVASGLVSLAALVIGILWARNATWWVVLLVLIVLPWLYYFAVTCYRRMSVHYVLTTQRFIHERGIVRHVNNRIEVLDMDDITFEQGLLERLTGVGTIHIVSHDRTDPDIILRGIEDVRRVAGLFDNARLAERRRRGLHVEQI